jgi:hypothetical protein
MSFRGKGILYIAALTLATPADAQAPAPTTTAFDGTYFGVSRTFEEDPAGRQGWLRGCSFLVLGGPPPPLKIVNGICDGEPAALRGPLVCKAY